MNKRTTYDYVFDTIVYIIMIITILVMAYPMWYCIAASFTSVTEMNTIQGLFLWPKKFNTMAYELVFQNSMFLTGFFNTLKIMAMSIPLSMFVTLLGAFFMAYSRTKMKPAIMAYIVFTMFFGGGLIPSYLNMQELGLMNSHFGLVISSCFGVYNAIIMRTAIQGVHSSLLDSAYLDGANDFQVLFKVMVPLIKPTMAVIFLWLLVGNWNSWFAASIYLKEDRLIPLQLVLQSVLVANKDLLEAGIDEFDEYANAIKYAAIVVSTVPILCVYPFLQKYFVKGVMIGSVKG